MGVALSLVSGAVVGFALALVGGGGSILAVPLLIYVVGIDDVHVAIGTSALAVSLNAFANLFGHWRAGNVKWPCAIVFAVTGVAGAALGSSLGKLVDGEKLLFLFALLMIAVGAAVLRKRSSQGNPAVRLTAPIALRLSAVGLLSGLLAGFFGVGGGFLIVPGLMLGSGMPIVNAVASSLLSVGSMAMTTAANYAWSHLIDWRIAALFLGGGIVGGLLGMKVATTLAQSRARLATVFAGLIFVVAGYMIIRNALTLFS